MFPELEADAHRVLNEANCPHRRVVAVDYDCILYVNGLGRARTLWLLRQQGDGRLRTRMVEGFQIEAPADFS